MMKQRTLLLALLVFVVMVWTTAPAFAQNTMTVTPVWRPGQELTTLVADSDYRYVDVQLMVTGNVQFWAVNMTCTFTPAVLEGYDPGSIIGDDGDDVPMVTWGPDWGTEDTDFIPVSAGVSPGGGLAIPDGYDFVAATGRLTLRATRLGSVPPLGINGAYYNMLLATLRLRVRDLGATFRTASATVKCTPMDFLDRDGRVVVKGKQGPTAPLAVRTGYSISGQALLQGGKNHAGIQVTCSNGVQNYNAATASNGNYSFGGTGQLIRETGLFNCVYSSSISSPQSEFLDAQVDLNLNSSTFYLLPVILKGGNLDVVTAGSQNAINFADLTAFTLAWSPGASTAAPYDSADVNGDRRETESDLAMFAGNYGLGANGIIDASHVLYGLATDYGGTFPNSRTYWGDPQAGPVQRLEDPKADRDFWPAMSPDGAKVAFSRLVTKTGKYVLYTTPTAKPRGVQLTPKSGFTDDALAPAWSPDGQRLAFICSTSNGTTTGYVVNEGDLCVINVNGTGLEEIATGVKIYAPAWFDNNVIIYASTASSSNVACQRNLCFIDLAARASGLVAAGLISDGDDGADMPGIGRMADGSAVLLYRFDNGSSNSLRARTIISYTLGAFTLGGEFTIATPGGGNDIDFYDVSPLLDVMYYESVVTSSVFRTIDGFINLNFAENGTLTADDWSAGGTHTVDGFVGNNTTSVFGGAWSGSGATVYHAQRATFDWVP